MSSSDRFTQIAVGAAMVVTVALFMVVHGPSLARTSNRTSTTTSAANPMQELALAPATAAVRGVSRARADEHAQAAAVPASFVDQTQALDTSADRRETLAGLVAACRDITRGELESVAGYRLPTLSEVQVYRDGDHRMVVAPGTSRRYAEVVAELLRVDEDQILASLASEETCESVHEPEPAVGMNRTVIADAIDQLLAVKLPEIPADMVARRTHWDFSDAEYAELSSAQKHLLLMGLDRARQVQAKLRAIRSAIADSPLSTNPALPETPQIDAMPKLLASAASKTPILEGVATNP